MAKKDKILEILKRIENMKIDSNSYLLIGKNKGTFPYSNSLLILDEEIVLIDSGLGREITRALKDHVDILINSHYHIDHIIDNHLFENLWVVENEAEATVSFEDYKKFAGIYNIPVEKQWENWFNDYFEFHPSKPSRTFKPNEIFDFGDTKWEPVHTPGHTEGHCCFYESERKIMYSTDIDLTPFGPWYGNPSAHLPDFIESIKKVIQMKIDVIASSHSFVRRDGIEEAFKRYLNVIYQRDEKILSLLREDKSLEDLRQSEIIYKKGGKYYEAFSWFERNMIDKHLERLREEDKVAWNEGGYKIK
jgi:glyoxylase-like metal-dependent hydrolase (beta-lactamase superfamily II)